MDREGAKTRHEWEGGNMKRPVTKQTLRAESGGTLREQPQDGEGANKLRRDRGGGGVKRIAARQRRGQH